MTYKREQIENAVKGKGYVWFEGAKDYDLNIVGIRNSSTGNKVTNVFDDIMTLRSDVIRNSSSLNRINILEFAPRATSIDKQEIKSKKRKRTTDKSGDEININD